MSEERGLRTTSTTSPAQFAAESVVFRRWSCSSLLS